MLCAICDKCLTSCISSCLPVGDRKSNSPVVIEIHNEEITICRKCASFYDINKKFKQL